jgi:cysteine-rich repeat protein
VAVGPGLNLPTDSFAYAYGATADGKSCSFITPTELGLSCDANGACAIGNNLFDATNGYCGDGITQTDLGEQCDDANKDNNDVCNNNCRWTVKTMPTVTFSSAGTADALVYSDNNTPNSITNTNGPYLKLDKMLDTPYAWFADTYNNLITQVRTYVKCYPYGNEDHPDDKWNLDPGTNGKTGYICPKKTPDGWDYSPANHQHPGEIIKDFPIIGYPSRTAVNVETGEVWIAARSGINWGDVGHVEKLQMDVNGDYSSVAKIPATQFSGLVRGLSIQRDGDIWVADCTSDYKTASIKRYSADSLTLNKTVGADGSFYCPYGLAIDSADNIWLNDMGGGGMKKVNPDTGKISTYTDAGIYGITVDNNDNAWGGGYSDYGIKKIPYGQDSGAAIHYTGFPYWQTNMTGITLDKDGNIWSGGYYPNYKTYKFDQNGVLQPGFPVASGGVNPHGIFGTSDGYVWQSHISSNIIRVFDPNGGVVADFKGGNIAGGIYTYSDATGLNRAMVMRSGLWVSTPVDSGINNQHWGIISWQQSLQSSKQNLEVYARADNDTDNLKNKSWVRVYLASDPDNKDLTWNALDITNDLRAGRYIQFKVLLRSMERGVTPVLWDLQVK